MRKLSIGLAVAWSLTAAAPALRAGDVHSVSANVALTTDYRFRGISQTNEDPAIQGGFDYSYNPLGIYAGVWASTLEFNTADTPTATVNDAASLEVDFYGGIAGDLPNGFGWDVGAIYYAYPSQDEEDVAGGDFDYVEALGSVSYTPPAASPMATPTLGASVYYSPDFFGETGDAVYLNGSLDLAFQAGFSLSAEVGWQDVDEVGDYVHWRIGASKEWKGIGFDLSYHDADDDCGAGTLCDSTVIFTVSAAVDLF